MRLVTWNACKGQFGHKFPMLNELRPDIAVVQEIEVPHAQTDQVLWFGDNPQLGMAVVAGKGYTLQALPPLPDVPKYVIPVAVDGPVPFVLFAVWTLGEQPMKYVRALSTAVDMYEHLFAESKVVVMGDFNSNAKWDKEHPKELNHSALVARLKDTGLVSVYHHHRKEPHGSEVEPTFYHQWNEAKPHHIDYCFVPNAWADLAVSVEVGTFEGWKGKSDHRPLVAAIRLSDSTVV